jgi:6,7-dimethyl-8-ribityllumazine synthase
MLRDTNDSANGLEVEPTDPSIRRFCIVASRYNREYVDGLRDHAVEQFVYWTPGAAIEVIEVPGAFEIPLVVQELATKRHGDQRLPSAILALGVVWAGETDHADQILRSVTSALQEIAVRSGVPVIHQVLGIQSEEHAHARCIDDKHNRGTEAAHAAIKMAKVLDQLRRA